MKIFGERLRKRELGDPQAPRFSIGNEQSGAPAAGKGGVVRRLLIDDQIKKGQDQVQKLTDKFIKQVDDLFSGKEKEIMEV